MLPSWYRRSTSNRCFLEVWKHGIFFFISIMMHTPKQLCYIPTMGQTLCELCVFQDEQSKFLPSRSPWFKWRRSKPRKLCTWVLWTCCEVPRKHWGGVLEAPNIGFVGVTFLVGLKGEEQPQGKWVPKGESEANVFPHVSSSVDGFSHLSGCTQHCVPGTALSTGQVLSGHRVAGIFPPRVSSGIKNASIVDWPYSLTCSKYRITWFCNKKRK